MRKTKGFIEPKGSRDGVRVVSTFYRVEDSRRRSRMDRRMDGRRDGWMGGGIQMHLVLYHQQTTRKKGHHDSWHFLCASLTVYVSSLHL